MPDALPVTPPVCRGLYSGVCLAPSTGKEHPAGVGLTRGEEGTMSIGPEKITKLAERISATAPAMAGGDEQGFRFIRPWRLNAGGTHEETKEVISCSECGCGISPDLK
jgi:hypothetical protein